MATIPNQKKIKKPLPAPRTGLKKADYIYALEVAGQPATTPAEKKMRRQAKADVKYLETKFPKYTAKNKSFGTRMTQPTHTGKSKPIVVSKGKKGGRNLAVRGKKP